MMTNPTMLLLDLFLRCFPLTFSAGYFARFFWNQYKKHTRIPVLSPVDEKTPLCENLPGYIGSDWKNTTRTSRKRVLACILGRPGDGHTNTASRQASPFVSNSCLMISRAYTVAEPNRSSCLPQLKN